MSSEVVEESLTSINSFCSMLEFSGDDCIIFLNKLLISDLIQLKNKKFNYTALCNPKGRIIASLWIQIIAENHIKLICPADMQELLINFFNMRKFRLKININVAKDTILIYANNVVIDNNQKQISAATKDGFYDFFLKQNLPWINKEFSEKFIPQHVNLDQHENIMSFTKGCYPGQEIIARLKYLGKIKKRMVLFKDKNAEQLLANIGKLKLVSPIIYSTSQNQYLVQVSKFVSCQK